MLIHPFSGVLDLCKHISFNLLPYSRPRSICYPHITIEIQAPWLPRITTPQNNLVLCPCWQMLSVRRQTNISICSVTVISQINSEINVITDQIQLTLTVVIQSELLLSNFYLLGGRTKLLSSLNSIKTIIGPGKGLLLFYFFFIHVQYLFCLHYTATLMSLICSWICRYLRNIVYFYTHYLYKCCVSLSVPYYTHTHAHTHTHTPEPKRLTDIHTYLPGPMNISGSLILSVT